MPTSNNDKKPDGDTLILTVRGGARICVPASLQHITTYVLLEQEDWFEDEIHFVRRYLKPGMRAVDVGANLGLYTLALAQAVGREGRVWAFEPTPRTANLLEQTLSLNGFDWVAVKRSAVSGRSGTIAFAATDKPEANSVASVDTPPGEVIAVSCVTLDEMAASEDWADLAFLKMDVEGHEVEVINGARSLLARASPLVMFEIKEGRNINVSVLDPLAQLGYEFYRLLPGPMILMPFEREAPIDDFQLNLFACKPQRAEQLAAEGLLVRSGEGKVGLPAPQAWAGYLERAPYARDLASRWPVKAGFVSSAADKAYHHGLAAFAASRDPQRSAAERCALLELAFSQIGEAATESDSVARKMSYARVAWEVGQRANAVNALFEAFSALESGAAKALTEPFLAPSSRYEQIPTGGRPRDWLRCAVTEQFEKLRVYSSKFAVERTLELLNPIIEDPLLSPEMDRRWQLARLSSSLQSAPHVTARLCAASDDNLNPGFWAGRQESASSGSDPGSIGGLWEGLPAVKIVDVGAMSLGEGADPYDRLTRAFKCEIVGFEPLDKECAELNAKAKPGRRYLPYFIGDGSDQTFYETNTGMTSSLFEPNTPLLAKFQHLEELTRVIAKHPVKTRKLDDIPEVQGADYLKIDVQGAELMVFLGARETLRSVLIVHTEVEFVELYKNQALFSDIDAFMRAEGFVLHKFDDLAGRILKPMTSPLNPYAPMSQILWSDAVYVRDFMALDRLAADQLLKLAAILHENYSSYDLAALALGTYDQKAGTARQARYLSSLGARAEGEAPKGPVSDPSPPVQAQGDLFRLHIGGAQAVPGWKNFNAQPGRHVDYVGDCSDLSRFADGSVDEIYASHVLEHLGYSFRLPRALVEFNRVLKSGGRAMISVPDLEVLCRLFLDPKLEPPDRVMVMRMMFGGQLDAYDFHYVGLTQEILIPYLREAGFSRLDRVSHFGVVADDSAILFAGTPISLNVIAYK